MATGNPKNFTQWYPVMCSAVARENKTLRIDCGTAGDARKLRSRWYNYKQALIHRVERKGETAYEADLNNATGVVCTLEDNICVFMPREETWDAKLLEASLASLGPRPEPPGDGTPTLLGSKKSEEVLKDLGYGGGSDE